MTTKADFAPEDWTALVQAPLNVAMLITVASPSLLGSMTEMYSAAQGLVAAGQQAPTSGGLLDSLFAEYRSQDTIKAAQPKYDTKDPALLRQEILKRIGVAAANVDQKATPEEAGAFKEWLYQFGVKQANASKEGGFLGMGAVRVSEKEKAALAELASTLGIQPPAEMAAQG